jgi:hypothetical protein
MPTFKEHIIKTGGGYKLVSKKTGKNLGTATTKAGIEKRERQVQYFKHMHEDKRMLTFKEFVREDESPITHHVVHIKTGNIVGKYTGLKAAQRAADKKDSAYGAVAHRVVSLPIKEDGMGAGAVAAGPTNTTGGGQVAGMGQPPGSKSGEPGVHLPRKKQNSPVMGYTSRKPPKM